MNCSGKYGVVLYVPVGHNWTQGTCGAAGRSVPESTGPAASHLPWAADAVLAKQSSSQGLWNCLVFASELQIIMHRCSCFTALNADGINDLRTAVQAAGATDLIGPGDPPGQRAQAEERDEDGLAIDAYPDVPASYTQEVATRYLLAHKGCCHAWMLVGRSHVR
jgi:hypothetical protein